MSQRSLLRNGGPLRVALVGCGRWGSTLARVLGEMDDFCLAWVCDPRVSWPGAAWAPELTPEVCQDVDAVLVATPAESHVAPAELALQCRKAVFIEKPFVRSLHEVARLERVRGGEVLMVGHLLVYHAAHQRLGEHVRTMRAQDHAPIEVQVTRTSLASGETRCPWWTLAPHDLALLSAWFGAPANLRVFETSDGVTARLAWQRVTARLNYSTRAPAKRRQWTVRCGSSEVMLDELTSEVIGLNEVQQENVAPLQRELAHFAHCVRTGQRPLTGFEEGRESVALLSVGQRQLEAVFQDRHRRAASEYYHPL